jgi:hypothetical protein
MSSCSDCFNYILCDYNTNISITDSKIKLYFKEGAEKCCFFKDKTKVVELPANIGETVYYFNTNCKQIDQCIIVKITQYTKKSIGFLLMKDSKTVFEVSLLDFNKTVFISKEIAEQVLKKEKEHKNVGIDG